MQRVTRSIPSCELVSARRRVLALLEHNPNSMRLYGDLVYKYSVSNLQNLEIMLSCFRDSKRKRENSESP